MPMTVAVAAPSRAHPPTSTGFMPCLATIVAPPETMMMKNPPGGGRRRAFCMNTTTAETAVAYRAMSSIHQSVPPASIAGQTTEPTKAPAICPRDSSSPAVTMIFSRERNGCPSP